MAALAPWNRVQSSWPPSRTGVIRTSSMPGFATPDGAGSELMPGSGGAIDIDDDIPF